MRECPHNSTASPPSFTAVGVHRKASVGRLIIKKKVITANERVSNKNIIRNIVIKMYGKQLRFFAKDVSNYCRPDFYFPQPDVELK